MSCWTWITGETARHLMCYFLHKLALCMSSELKTMQCNSALEQFITMDTKSIPKYILDLCDSWMTWISILLKSICIVWHTVLEAVVFRTWEYSLLCELTCAVCLMLQHIINKVLKPKGCIIYFFMKQQHVCSITTPTIQWKTAKLCDSMSCYLHSMHIATVTHNKHTILKINMRIHFCETGYVSNIKWKKKKHWRRMILDRICAY